MDGWMVYAEKGMGVDVCDEVLGLSVRYELRLSG